METETLLSFQGFIVYFSASPSSSLVSRVVSLFHLQPFFLWGHQVFALPALQILGLYQLILCINLQFRNMAKLFVPPPTFFFNVYSLKVYVPLGQYEDPHQQMLLRRIPFLVGQGKFRCPGKLRPKVAFLKEKSLKSYKKTTTTTKFNNNNKSNNNNNLKQNNMNKIKTIYQVLCHWREAI